LTNPNPTQYTTTNATNPNKPKMKRYYIIEYTHNDNEYATQVLGDSPEDALATFLAAEKPDTQDEKVASYKTADGTTVYHSGFVGYELFSNKKIKPTSDVTFK